MKNYISLIMTVVVLSGCTLVQAGSVKEFSLQSTMTFRNGSSVQELSPKEITACKGDTVRIYVNETFAQRPEGSMTIGTGFERQSQNVTRRSGRNFTRSNNQSNGIMFNIDELNVHGQLQIGKVTAIEFTASQTGEFRYYIGANRTNGGILKIV